MYKEFVDEKGMDSEVVMEMIYARSRDNARTPMHAMGRQRECRLQRRHAMDAGEPQLSRDQRGKGSCASGFHFFRYYQRLIRLRKENPVIVYGVHELILDAHEEIYAFTRTLGSDRLLVILNFTKNVPVFALRCRVTVRFRAPRC